jgi:hypothetical protein
MTIIREQLNFLGYGYMGTGGILTTDNIPETTEIFGFPTNNIPEITEKGSMVITRKKTSTTHKNKIMKKKTLKHA